MDTADNSAFPPGRGCAVLVVPQALRQLCRRVQDHTAMSAALRLVRDSGGDDGDLPPLEGWELFMRGAGRAERTVYDGVLTVRRLERFSGKTVEHITPIDVSRFLAGPNLKAWSRAAYFSSIAAFYRWYADNGGANVTARLPRPKMPKSTPRPISDEQLQALLAIRMHKRTRVMILLAALAGLRVHEIAKVRGEDVDRQARTLRVTGKGGRTETLPLHPLLVEVTETMPRRGWWFPANSRRPGEHVHGKAVTDIIKDAMDRAGIPGGTAHRIRHWYGSKLVADGTDLRTAQTLLRHANLNTTAIYVQVADPKRVEAIDRLDPSAASRRS
jgi:integrase/recombinase XerD